MAASEDVAAASEDVAVSVAIETHEADVWARCAQSCAALPDNPLGAVVEPSDVVPLTALSALDSQEFNRVLGLGVQQSDPTAISEAIDAAVEFYRGLGQSDFRFELAPIAATGETIAALEKRGFHLVPGTTTTKLWRMLDGQTDQLDDVVIPDVEVRRLTPSDADQFAALNVRAWGAWTMREPMHPWFLGSVGAKGFTHYGIFDRECLLATGPLCIDGDLAWLGFDATHPRSQGRSLRRSLTLQRLADARMQGCKIMHAEARANRLTSRGRFFDSPYERAHYAYGQGTDISNSG